MVHAEPVFQLLYVSRLAPGCDFGVVKDIVAVARRYNAEHGITGALLFDGERFGQLLEGAEVDVRALMSRIARDPRHTDVQVLYAGQCLTARAMQRWASRLLRRRRLRGVRLRNGAARPAGAGRVRVGSGRRRPGLTGPVSEPSDLHSRDVRCNAAAPASRAVTRRFVSSGFQLPKETAMANPKDNPDLQGEGNYDATRRYDKAAHEFAQSGKVGDAARAAKPANPEEAEALKRAERAGRSHSKGEDPAPTTPPPKGKK